MDMDPLVSIFCANMDKFFGKDSCKRLNNGDAAAQTQTQEVCTLAVEVAQDHGKRLVETALGIQCDDVLVARIPPDAPS